MISVTTETELREAIYNLEEEILIENDIQIMSRININYEVLIRSENQRTLFWTGASTVMDYMFNVTESGKLTIEGLILDGEDRNCGFVEIYGGTFIIEKNTILQNIYSRSARNAVSIGDYTNAVGGIFKMNSGLITNIDSSDVVFNYSGEVYLSGDAKIDNNKSAGVSMMRTNNTDIRPKLTMSGEASISNNSSRQGASAGIMLNSDVIMGVEEGDKPSVNNNKDEVALVGAWYLSSNSTLTMRYDSEIVNNSSVGTAGAIGLAYDSTLHLYDNTKISNNTAGTSAGGVIASSSTIILEGNSSIDGNIALGNAGGVNLQSSSTLILLENASITNNKSNGYGGGVYIDASSTLNMQDNSIIKDNEALNGSAIYQLGNLYIKDSPQIDGLYINNTLPIIADALTEEAVIQLEESNYVNPQGVPLTIALKGEEYETLSELDKNAWLIPPSFSATHQVILNENKSEVLIVLAEFTITYENLEEATHSNPLSYTAEDLPIQLSAPTKREGFEFLGWQNEDKEIITEIPVGTTGNLVIMALWKEIYLYFKCSCCRYCTSPAPVRAKTSRVVIPLEVPKRCCYRFICYNIPSSGTGKVYFPGDVIYLEHSLTLYAQWQRI